MELNVHCRSVRHPGAFGVGVAVAVLSLAFVAGCAQPGGPMIGGSSPGSSTEPGNGSFGTVAPSGAGPSTNVTDATGCGVDLRVTQTDTGRRVCLHLGGTITVVLEGAVGQQMWRPIAVTGDVLDLAAGPSSPSVSLTTTDTFRAVGLGTARLSSTRSICPVPKPGTVACMAMEGFTLTVDVR
jgi:hypothetical protein